jgi:CubicO group peptidase (beta-lactamase class C family)
MKLLQSKLVIGLLILFVVISSVYWQDPWLWRNYIRFFSSGDPHGIEMLPPDEEIRGDGSLVLPVAAPAERTVAVEALAAMHAFAEEFGSHALITVHKGVIQDEWYGDHWQADYLTQSQSMHKSLMGLFIGIAIEEGKIESVDDPIGRYLQEWANDPRGEITFRNLMTMSSGLDQYDFTLNPFDDGVKWLNSGYSGEVVLRTPNLDVGQGVEWEYNNLNSELIGMVLERVYGKRYSELLREKLWLPMGGDRALVHTDSPGGRAFTSCCLMAPAMDWVRVGMMFLNRGEVNGNRIVSGDWIDEMVTPAPVAGFYGYQIWLGYDDPMFPAEQTTIGSSGAVAREAFLARDTYMTWGRGQQHVYVVPSEELIIVRLGPALGRQPIKPGYDVSFLVNTALRGMDR